MICHHQSNSHNVSSMTAQAKLCLSVSNGSDKLLRIVEVCRRGQATTMAVFVPRCDVDNYIQLDDPHGPFRG